MVNLLPKEEERAYEFIKKHSKCTLNDYARVEYTGFKRLLRKLLGKPLVKYKLGPYPGHFSYKQSPCSGIGIETSIRCNYCGEEKDITDYELW